MAPQYAPSLRSRLAPLLLILQTGFIIIAALCFENKETNKPDRKSFFHFYPGEFIYFFGSKNEDGLGSKY